jgi:hypothetical protein
MGKGGVNAHGQTESTSRGASRPNEKPRDPHRTAATDPRYHLKRRAVNDAAHDAILNTIDRAGSVGSGI